ncbi:MAG: hypothetical protein JNJ83_17805 [Verrucomicrobiaceae bacterium]|nr:hypothetical protein [Verrucomicrobiaceae bacterium]
MTLPTSTFLLARGGIGNIVKTFIWWIVYDICVTGISDALGVSRMVALLIFLGVMLLIGFLGYVFKQKASGAADD